MGAFTSFLNLYKPGGGSTGLILPDEVADIDKLNLNFDDIDTFASGTDARINVLETPVRFVNRRISASNLFTDQTTYADLPNSADATALASTFTKRSATSGLLVTLHASAEMGSGGTQLLYFGLRVDTTDYDVAITHYQSTGRRQFEGQTLITGVPVGSFAVKPRFKSGTASAVFLYANDDFVQYSIMEVPV